MVNSKHCKKCDRCISGFDHHCRFINLCIGEKNYRWFVWMCISVIFDLIAKNWVILAIIYSPTIFDKAEK